MYLLISKIPEFSNKDVDEGQIYLMTKERDSLKDMLSQRIDFETGLLAQVNTMTQLHDKVRSKIKRAFNII